VLRDIEHAVGESPLVVEPGQQVDQVWAGHTGLAAIDDGRVGIVVEVAAGVRQLSVGQQVSERPRLGGVAQDAVDLGGAGGAAGLQGDVQADRKSTRLNS